MKKLLLITSLLVLPYSAMAAQPKAFACFSANDAEKASPITLIKGTPQVRSAVFLSADTVIPAHFKLNGLVRQWYFGCDENTRECNYTFKVNANGVGYYYDFSNSDQSTPSMKFACKATAVPKEIYKELSNQ